MNAPQITANLHPTLDKIHQLPSDNIHRVAYDIAEKLRSIGTDPKFPDLVPKPITVGSFPLFPNQANDLDFEIQGVSWQHLQDKLWEVRDQFKTIFLTKGLPSGEIPQDSRSEGYGGNAFVAVWLEMHDGRKVNVSIPTRVSEKTNRYDLSTVQQDPEMDFKDAASRRSFAHKSVGFNPLTRELLDPHGGQAALASKILKVIDPASFRKDPLNIYMAIHEMSHLDMTPDADSRDLLIQMAAVGAPQQDSSNFYAPRLNYERARLLISGAPPSVTLENARSCGLIASQMPTLSQALLDDGLRMGVMSNVDQAWGRARAETSWDDYNRIVMVLGALCADIKDDLSVGEIVSYFNTGTNDDERSKFITDVEKSILSYKN